MNVIHPLERTGDPFLDGKTKLLLIDGKWVEAASRRTFKAPSVPFGGYEMNGYGRESGLQHLDEYLNVKAVSIKTA